MMTVQQVITQAMYTQTNGISYAQIPEHEEIIIKAEPDTLWNLVDQLHIELLGAKYSEQYQPIISTHKQYVQAQKEGNVQSAIVQKEALNNFQTTLGTGLRIYGETDSFGDYGQKDDFFLRYMVNGSDSEYFMEIKEKLKNAVEHITK